MVDDHSSGDGTNVTGTNDVHTTDSDQNLQCETLDEAWMCSSGSKNHSHCIKFCTAGLDFYDIICYIFNHFMLFLDFCLTVKIQSKDGPTEHRKCLCKHKECSWAQKSKTCPIVDPLAISNGQHSGDISDLTMGFEGLRTIVREMTLTNNGNIYLNLNL